MLGLMALLLPPDLVFPFRMPTRERYARGASISLEEHRYRIKPCNTIHLIFYVVCVGDTRLVTLFRLRKTALK